MLEQLISEKSHLAKHLNAPLLEERVRYLRHIRANVNGDKDYLLRVAVQMLRTVEFLHLKDNDSSLVSVKAIEEFAEEWRRTGLKRSKKLPYSEVSKNKLLTSAIKWLKYIGRMEPQIDDAVPIFNELFKRAYTQKKMVAAPLLEERVEYLQYWKDNGAARNTLRIIAEYELHIIKYLSITHLRVIGFGEIRKASKIWAKEENVTRRTI